MKYSFLIILGIDMLISQTKITKLDIFNKTNQIVCIITKKFITEMEKDTNNEYDESYSDFIFHSNELKRTIKINVNIYICDNATFLGNNVILMDKSDLYYIFIKKGDKSPFIIYGIDTAENLKMQAKDYFGKQFIN